MKELSIDPRERIKLGRYVSTDDLHITHADLKLRAKKEMLLKFAGEGLVMLMGFGMIYFTYYIFTLAYAY